LIKDVFFRELIASADYGSIQSRHLLLLTIIWTMQYEWAYSTKW